MNNLIESGIEVVWFSNMTQSDVVYGVCVQREEKRITVVFRGTVNSHNWLISMVQVANILAKKSRLIYILDSLYTCHAKEGYTNEYDRGDYGKD